MIYRTQLIYNPLMGISVTYTSNPILQNGFINQNMNTHSVLNMGSAMISTSNENDLDPNANDTLNQLKLYQSINCENCAVITTPMLYQSFMELEMTIRMLLGVRLKKFAIFSGLLRNRSRFKTIADLLHTIEIMLKKSDMFDFVLLSTNIGFCTKYMGNQNSLEGDECVYLRRNFYT